MSTKLLRSRRPSSSHFIAVAAVLAIGCGTPETSDDTPTDYPSVPVSDACGGKCDDPDAVLNASPNRFIGELAMENYETADGEVEIFELVAPLLEERAELVEEGHTLEVAIYAADGAADQEFQIESQLVLTEGVYVSEMIDTSDLLPWQLLRVDVTGVAGEQEINQTFEFAPGNPASAEVLPEYEDPFAQASDPTIPVIYIDPSVPAPDYKRADVDGFNLGGTEFWQRWEGGHDPTFSYSAGTELGRKCMYASARRFEAIMADPPESIVQLREETNWGGSFFNWNDDYSHEEATRRPSGAVLWAWKTHLIKFISQTADDGSCFLPTLDMMEQAAANCLAKGEQNDGNIEGCQAY